MTFSTMRHGVFWSTIFLAFVVSMMVPQSAPARGGQGLGNVQTGENPDAQKLGDVQFNQRLEAAIPLDLSFRDSDGETVRLERYFRNDRPVIVVLGYRECPMLCGLVRKGLVRALGEVGLKMGEDYEVVSVSIDPDEPLERSGSTKETVLERYRSARQERGAEPAERAASGWHALTGDKEQIDALADAVGFEYRYDPKKEQYMHASGFVIATAGGTISQYQFGVEYDPGDVRLGLVEASDGRVGSPVDQVLLRCYQYDPETGSYSLTVMKSLRWLGLATVLLIGGAVWSLRRSRRQSMLDDEGSSEDGQRFEEDV